MFSALIRLSNSTSNLPFLVFFTVFGVTLVEITCLKKGDNFPWQTSSKDSITMNLGKSVASFSESDSDRSHLFFFNLKTPYMLYILRWPCAPSTIMESNLYWERTKEETHSPSLRRGYATSILDQYTRCQFQVFTTSQIPILPTPLTLSHYFLAPNR